MNTKAEIKAKFAKLKDNTNSFIPRSKMRKIFESYEVHDNGGRPFTVLCGKDEIVIVPNQASFLYSKNLNKHIGNSHGRTAEDKKKENKPAAKAVPKNITITKFLGYWPGFDTSKYTNFHGNSILIQETKTTYVFIGWTVTRFTLPVNKSKSGLITRVDEIVDYISPVGNSDVPYPVAYTKSGVIFMLDMDFIPMSALITKPIAKNAEAMYGEFYGHVNKENHDNVIKATRGLKSVKTLIDRFV